MYTKQTSDTNKLQTHDSLWAAYLIIIYYIFFLFSYYVRFLHFFKILKIFPFSQT